MKLTLSYINTDITRFVPRSIFIPKTVNEKVWLTVNFGIKPPTPCKEILSSGDKLALDGQYIEMIVGDRIDVRQHDTVNIGEYYFYVIKSDSWEA